jgi:serine/threonine-protein kinase
MTDPTDRLATTLADRYTIERELGAGGMATVYLAHDVKHDRKVALKVLRPELAAVLGADRFIQEIKTTANLQHPHILALFDSGEADSFLYYVMPYVEGESLREKLNREKQLSIEEAVEITKSVASALDYAHRHNVIHRDIKPENILLHDGQPMVADFGIALAVQDAGGERLTETGLSLGTPEYMSPEQATGDPSVDARSDVYALGCVLYEMLAGEPPFLGRSAASLIAKHAVERAPSVRRLRPTVPEVIDSSLNKAMAKAPADRFQTAGELSGALSTEPARPTPVIGRKPVVFSVLFVAVVALLVLLATWWSGRDDYGAATPDPRRIAVLYFDDLSPGGDATHLAAGLTEGLIHELSQVDELEVISRNGVKPYRNADSSIAAIAHALQVGTFVEGSIQRVGDRVRVTVQLIDAVSLGHLASRSVNRPWGDWLALQQDVSQEVAWFLRQRLGREIVLREGRSRTSSGEAWELVQRATLLIDEVTQRGGDPRPMMGRLDQADQWLREAIELDASWPEPLVLRGRIALIASAPVGVLDSALHHRVDSIAELAVDFANAALALQPDGAALELRGQANALRGWLQSDPASRRRWLDLAETDFRAAVAEDESQAQAWAGLSRVSQLEGRVAEANVAARQALAADPFLQNADQLMRQLFWTSLELGQDADAQEWCVTGRGRFADQSWTVACDLTLMALSNVRNPDPQQAQQLVTAYLDAFSGAPDERVRLEAEWQTTFAAILARSGMRDSAQAVMQGEWKRWRSDSGFGMTMHELYVALLVEDSILMSVIVREDLYADMDTVFMMGDFWGRALLRDTILRRRAGLPLR